MDIFLMWLKYSIIRALKTMIQTAIAMIPIKNGFNQITWKIIVLTSILAGMISIFTSVFGLPETKLKEKEV